MATESEQLRREGYVLVRDVFSSAEIRGFRRKAREGRSWRGDLLSNPWFCDLVLDHRILEIAHALLGDTPVYFGDSAVAFGPRPRQYHKDNVDRDDGEGPDWKGEYPLIQFGLYLQDYLHYSGGLCVRVGSHNRASHEGQEAYVASAQGDVVVWNLRSSHTGMGTNPANPSPSPGERIALFMTFGLPSQHLERFIASLKTRASAVERWRHSRYTNSVRHLFNGRALYVRDMHEEIRGVRGLGLDQTWRPIPYESDLFPHATSE